MKITELKPAGVWKSFDALTQIPRPSGHTKAVAQFLVKFAKENGVKAKIDTGGNVVMQVPATKGMEDRQTIVLQAHMDMVPQKTEDSKHDFTKDPIETWIDGEWVRARNTTLGADDGMGVAAAMAIISDKKAKHGPLEILITRDEETGMYGANELKSNELKGQYLLNLDSETEGEITIGCAGGIDITATMQYQEEILEEKDKEAFRISINGLFGGHSGLEINEGRANANKLMARALFAIVNTGLAQVCEWRGGNMRNAIPRDGEAIVVVPKAKVRSFKLLTTKCSKIFEAEYKDIEKVPVRLTVEKTDMPKNIIPQAIQENIINAVMAAPNGVIRNIPTIPSIVETSINLSIIEIAGGNASIALLARSSSDSMKQAVCNQTIACFSMAGMKVKLSGSYSGWQPNPSSPLVKLMEKTYKKLFKEDAKVLVVHAGLECGIIGPKYPRLDMASIGPTLLSPHTPNERCYIPSVEKFYNYILEILKNIPKK